MRLAAEIIAYILIGLIMVPLMISTIRAWIDGKQEAWSPADIPTQEAKAAAESWLRRIPVALDIWINVTFLNGEQDETISTHAWRASLEGKTWGRWMTAWLNLWQPNHGYKAACGDLERAENRVKALAALLKGQS